MVAQIKDGNRSIIGLMIESNIHEGNQSPSSRAAK
ncbi:phospho-2-dehydro-3-deoxyheptonate aldolase [Salmonella enterica subsp. enterica serovar Newport str. WA_14881]|nr:phospho-2-dehydro-3-deoxyheptonate aldolase [Salmonella enterica subsp. enterica serovar Newport str. WA_14881]